jgi:hypothetical protein
MPFPYSLFDLYNVVTMVLRGIEHDRGVHKVQWHAWFQKYLMMTDYGDLKIV